MYFAVAALLILATSSPLTAYKLPATGSGELAKEFQEILDLIPLDGPFGVLEITRVYATKDVDFRTMLSVIGSDDMKKLLQFVEDAPELKEVLDYVQNHGLDIYYMINKVNEVFDLDPIVPLTLPNRKITGGVHGYLKDIAAIVPMDQIIDVFSSKMKKPGPLSDLVNFIQQPKFIDFYYEVFKNEHYLELEKLAEELGVEHFYFQTYLPLLIIAYTIVQLGL